MRVALAQMTSVPNLHLNIKFIEDNIIKAKKNNADLIVFLRIVVLWVEGLKCLLMHMRRLLIQF